MVLNQTLNLYAKYGFKPMLRFTLVLNLLLYHSICYHGNILLISVVNVNIRHLVWFKT